MVEISLKLPHRFQISKQASFVPQSMNCAREYIPQSMYLHVFVTNSPSSYLREAKIKYQEGMYIKY